MLNPPFASRRAHLEQEMQSSGSSLGGFVDWAVKAPSAHALPAQPCGGAPRKSQTFPPVFLVNGHQEKIPPSISSSVINQLGNKTCISIDFELGKHG